MFETKDEKMSRLEKKIYNVERHVEYNLKKMNESIAILNEVILRLQRENMQLRGERDFLIERHKKMLRRVPVPDLAGEINEKFVKPAVDRIKENAEFVQLVAKEGFVEIKEKERKREYRRNPAKELKEHIIDVSKHSNGKSIDKLFEIVNKMGKIRADEAARKLNVHEVQIEEWGKILEENELVALKKQPLGKLELVKI